MQFNFKIAQNAGAVNKATDFLSRLEFKVTEKIRLKNREDVQATHIEVTTSSAEVADEKLFFFTQTDDEKETKEQTYTKKNSTEKMPPNE